MREAEMAIPHLFRCPISLDLFTDPVTLCTGQTYDRSSIEKWLSAGNLTCPVTMQKLPDPSMVPNHTLRHLINQWLQFDNNVDPDCFKMIDPDHSLVALKHNLESHESTFETKLQTLEKIQVLSAELPMKNTVLIELGFFPLLLELALRSVEGTNFQDHLKFVEQALICALKLLPFSDLGSLNLLKEGAKLAYFLVLFEQGTSIIQKSLCHLVGSTSSSMETKDLCAMLGKTRALSRGMIHLLHENSEASEAAIKAISALCSLESNRVNMVREGAVRGLITYISNAERCERSLAPMAMATVELLLGLESGKEALINQPNGVNVLVKMVFRVSDHEGSESAVNSLMIICFDSLQATEKAICAGVLTQLLLLLQSQCSGRTKTKARMLLKLLRSMWADDPKNTL
ncbi:unnamed protein product [Ilex paraguariensis]|uniref:U-box domain-containing protein n=1 Tax=Ilex paraguariensis TaxID=185542 RepID=A0ABC8REP0_9AQUA